MFGGALVDLCEIVRAIVDFHDMLVKVHMNSKENIKRQYISIVLVKIPIFYLLFFMLNFVKMVKSEDSSGKSRGVQEKRDQRHHLS